MVSDSGGLTAWLAGRWPGLRRVIAERVVPVDTVLAVLVGAATLAGSINAAAQAHARSMDGLGYGLAGLAVAALVVRRRAPVLAFGVCFAATMVFLTLRYPFGPIIQLVGLMIYSVGAWRSARVSSTVCAATLAVFVPVEVWGLRASVTPGNAAVTLAWVGLPWLAGLAVRAYRAVRARLDAAGRQRVVDQERLRMAREVHDAVGHGLAVINMHAGIALHVLRERPEPHRVESGLRAIRDASGQALAELRTALAALPAETDRDERGAPGLNKIAALAKAVAGEHLSVEVVVDGAPDRIPAEVDEAGYRIVQESLTNVLRHAAAGHATVRVCYEPAAVRLTITDDGRGGPPGGTGLGLPGMRDRARAVGGTVRAGPRAEGGFEVRAVLPRAAR